MRTRSALVAAAAVILLAGCGPDKATDAAGPNGTSTSGAVAADGGGGSAVNASGPWKCPPLADVVTATGATVLTTKSDDASADIGDSKWNTCNYTDDVQTKQIPGTDATQTGFHDDYINVSETVTGSPSEFSWDDSKAKYEKVVGDKRDLTGFGLGAFEVAGPGAGNGTNNCEVGVKVGDVGMLLIQASSETTPSEQLCPWAEATTRLFMS